MAKPSDDLIRLWRLKLADSGFKDLETYQNGEFYMKPESGTVSRFRSMSSLTRENKERFFQILSEKIHETDFDTSEERIILTLYSEGLTKEQIRKKVSQHLKRPYHRSTIYERINKYLEIWRLK